MTEDEMVGWHHQLDGLEFEQALGVDDGQGGLVCCSPWGCKESVMTEWLNNNNIFILLARFILLGICFELNNFKYAEIFLAEGIFYPFSVFFVFKERKELEMF